MPNKTRDIIGFTLLPPARDVCQECAVKHKPEDPHDANSLYYQLVFYRKHGRYPTWEDALQHCPEAIKDAWEEILREIGEWEEKRE